MHEKVHKKFVNENELLQFKVDKVEEMLKPELTTEFMKKNVYSVKKKQIIVDTTTGLNKARAL